MNIYNGKTIKKTQTHLIIKRFMLRSASQAFTNARNNLKLVKLENTTIVLTEYIRSDGLVSPEEGSIMFNKIPINS